MPIRRFLIASSLARLVRKECSGIGIIEGYFPRQTDRSSHVHVEGEKGFLVLATSTAAASPVVERTEVPQAHAAALLDLVEGKIDYVRCKLPVAGHEVFVDHFAAPEPLDLISVEFQADTEADAFAPQPWFGPEITDDATYLNRSMALQGFPDLRDVPLSNVALDSFLDARESRSAAPELPRVAAVAEKPKAAASVEVPTSPLSTPSLPSAVVQRPAIKVLRPAAINIRKETAGSTKLDLEAEVAKELARALRGPTNSNRAKAG